MLSALLLVTSFSLQDPILPKYSFGGREVIPKIPTWAIPEKEVQVVEVDGTAFNFSKGTFLGRRIGTSWSELPPLLKTTEKPLIWKMNVYVTASEDRRYSTPSGLPLFRRIDIDGRDEEGLKQELALFDLLVRAYTGGRIQFQFTYDIDKDAEVVDGPRPASSYDTRLPEPAQSGPTSLMVINSGIASGTVTGRRHGVVYSEIPFNSVFDVSRPGLAARHFFNVWVDQLKLNLADSGYPELTVSPISSSTDIDAGVAPLVDPEEVLIPGAIEKLTDDVSLPVEPVGNAAKDPNVAPASFVESATKVESKVALGAGAERDFLYVVPTLVKTVQARLKEALFLGYTASGSQYLALFSIPKQDGTSDASILRLQPQPKARIMIAPATKNGFGAGDAENLRKFNTWEAQTLADGERGAIGFLRELGAIRAGGVRILGMDGVPIGNATALPYLSMWIKAGKPYAPIDLLVETTTDFRRFRMFGQVATVESSNQPIHLDVPIDDSWHKVTINLAEHGLAENLSAVYLAAPSESKLWRQQAGSRFYLDDVELAENGSPTPIKTTTTLGPDPRSPEPYQRLLFINQLTADATEADIAELRAMLSDTQDDIRLAAVSAVNKLGVKTAERQVMDIAYGLNLRSAIQAFDSLSKSETQEATALIRSSILKGPFDHTRRIATDTYIKSTQNPDVKSAPDISVLLVSRSWRSRLVGGQSLSMLKGENTPLVAMSFLNDSEPRVRLGVVQSLDVKIEAVSRRILEVAKLDPNLSVRASALARLLQEPTELRASASQILKEATPALKVLVCGSFNPSLSSPEALTLLLSDPDWHVRVAAVESLSSFKETTPDQLNAFANDPDRRVRMAIERCKGNLVK